jgi:hypothetical protein
VNDITLISVPYTIIETPPLGIAVLKGAVESEGLSCKTLDLGMELYKQCQGDRVFFDLVQNYFSAPNKANSPDILNCVQKFVDHWALKLVNYNSRWIGISVFSYFSHYASFLLCLKIKQINPLQKIAIGGPGIGTKIRQELWKHLGITEMEKLLSFGDVFKKRHLADACILGDGEQALIDLLRENKSTDQFHMESYRTHNHAYANFDDFDLSAYQGQLNRGAPQLPIFSSKGCVRNCDFCDVNSIQNRFRFRNGKNVVDEMIYLADRYNLRDFVFQDSLVNGSLKSLKEWVTALAEYNIANPDKRITWSASGWICRPIGQIPENFYPVLAQSGLQTATIGMETGSNRVLKAMDKKTNIEALYYEVEQFRKNNIKFIGLLIVGHWNEQWEDFLDTAVMIYRLSRYVKTGNLVAVNPGTTFTVINDTPADRNFEINRLVQHSSKNIWWTELNPSLTAKERYFRLILLERLLNELKVPLMEQVLPYVKLVVENNLVEMKKFYHDVTNNWAELPQQHSEYYLNNFEKFLEVVVSRSGVNDKIDLGWELESSVTNNDPPVIEISLNSKIIYSGSLTEGIHNLTLDQVRTQDQNTLIMRFLNKHPNDTIVDEQGNIIKDKFVRIKKFTINGFDLTQDVDFFYRQFDYVIDNVHSDVSTGFWFNNSSLSLTFATPFELWYGRTSTRFAHFDARVVTDTTLPDSRTNDHSQYKPQLIELLQQMAY